MAEKKPSFFNAEAFIHTVRQDIQASVEGTYPTRPYVACVFGAMAHQILRAGGKAYFDVLTPPLAQGRKPSLALMRKAEIDKGRGFCYLAFKCDPYVKGYLAISAEQASVIKENIAVLPVVRGAFSDENLRAMSRMVNDAHTMAARALG